MLAKGQRSSALGASDREQGPPALIDTALDDQHLVLVLELLGDRDLLCAAARVSKRWCAPPHTP